MSVSVAAATTSTTVNLSTSDLKVHEELPAVHWVASLLKRWLLGTHQGAVSPEHFQTYLEINVPLQSPHVTPARAALLAPTPGCCGFRAAQVRPARQDTQGQTPGSLSYATHKSPARPSPAGDYRAAVARCTLSYRNRLERPLQLYCETSSFRRTLTEDAASYNSGMQRSVCCRRTGKVFKREITISQINRAYALG
jgi:hypothetical protein